MAVTKTKLLAVVVEQVVAAKEQLPLLRLLLELLTQVAVVVEEEALQVTALLAVPVS